MINKLWLTPVNNFNTYNFTNSTDKYAKNIIYRIYS